MKALISTLEPVKTGFRVAQVEEDANIFPVASSLFWVTCDENVVADQFWFDPSDEIIKIISQQVLVMPANSNQPISVGSETL